MKIDASMKKWIIVLLVALAALFVGTLLLQMGATVHYGTPVARPK